MLFIISRCATAVGTLSSRHGICCGMMPLLRPFGVISSFPIAENLSDLRRFKSDFERSNAIPSNRLQCSVQQQTRLFHMTSLLCDVPDPRTTSDKSAEEKKIAETASENIAVKSNQRQRLKLAVREYGATVVIFHTCISLFTLGVSYAAVSSGVDVVGLLSRLGVGQSILESKIATGASTFVIAYAAHKVFAPARMATTLAATPFIVRYLRRIGLLKRPPPKL